METSLAWAFWSIFLYLICSIGYIVIDVLNYLLVISDSTLYILYIILASLLVVEAIFYAIDWAQYVFGQSKSTSIWKLKLKFSASIFHIIGSIAYLLAGIFGNSTVQNQQSFLTTPQLYVYNIVGAVALLIEAILTHMCYTVHGLDMRKSCHCSCGVPLWAHLLNIIAGLIYLGASVLPLIITAATSTLSETTIYQNYVRPVQIAGDSVYLIDSMLYMVLWIKEWKHRNKEEEPFEPESRGPIFLR